MLPETGVHVSFKKDFGQGVTEGLTVKVESLRLWGFLKNAPG